MYFGEETLENNTPNRRRGHTEEMTKKRVLEVSDSSDREEEPKKKKLAILDDDDDEVQVVKAVDPGHFVDLEDFDLYVDGNGECMMRLSDKKLNADIEALIPRREKQKVYMVPAWAIEAMMAAKNRGERITATDLGFTAVPLNSGDHIWVVLNGDDHYSFMLCLIEHNLKADVYHFDSAYPRHEILALKVMALLKSLRVLPANCTMADHFNGLPQQRGGWECGYFTLGAALGARVIFDHGARNNSILMVSKSVIDAYKQISSDLYSE